MNEKNGNRIAWIEGLRFVAVLMVIIPHFIACFCPQAFEIWTTYSWALCGINGKHGVVIFCVLAGYFASKPIQTTLPEYVVRRYIQFAFNVLVIILFYLFVCKLLNFSLLYSVWGGEIGFTV